MGFFVRLTITKSRIPTLATHFFYVFKQGEIHANYAQCVLVTVSTFRSILNHIWPLSDSLLQFEKRVTTERQI